MSLLHKKNTNVSQVVLCSRMDLIGVIYGEGSVAVFRTISWERLLHAKLDGEVEAGPNKRFSAVFSPSGNILTLGGTSATMLNIVSGQFTSVGEDLSNDYIVDLAWKDGTFMDPDRKILALCTTSWDETDRRTENASLLTLTRSLLLTIYQYGIIPVMQLQLMTPFERLIDFNATRFFHESVALALSRSDDNGGIVPLTASYEFEEIHFSRYSHMARVIFDLKFHMQKIRDSANSISKKWKESLRVFPPKVELMNSALRGYDLQMTLVEFMHTVVLCGMWHPAASVIFTQHWNEQSLSRLRSSIDSALKFIQRSISLHIVPSIESMIVLTKFATQSASAETSTWQRFMSECLKLLQASDKLLIEVQRVAEVAQKMLLFFRSSMTEAGGAATNASYCALHTEDRLLLQDVFGAERTVPTNNPEYLFNTNLTKHLTVETARFNVSSLLSAQTKSQSSSDSESVESKIAAVITEIVGLDEVPLFATQLKATTDAHDALCIVSTATEFQLNFVSHPALQTLFQGLKTSRILAQTQLHLPNKSWLHGQVLQKIDFLDLVTYEVLLWKEQSSDEEDGEEVVEVLRVQVPRPQSPAESASTDQSPWCKLLFKQESAELVLLWQDSERLEDLLYYAREYEVDDDFTELKTLSWQQIPVKTFEAPRVLSISRSTVLTAEYNEARGILAVVCPNVLFVFDASTIGEEEEEGGDDMESD